MGDPRPELKKSFVSNIAQRVVEACRQEDAQARITFVGRDEAERTRVRVRSDGSASVEALQRALAKLMPYAHVSASVDALDGSPSAEILIPSADDEFAAAYKLASRRWLSRVLNSAAFVCLFVGLGMWISAEAEVEERDI